MQASSLLAADAGTSIATALLDFGLLMLGLGVLARLAALLGVSAVPFYLLAGLCFGQGGLLPLGVNAEFVHVAAEIGAILLLLLLGLEYSGDELVGTVRHQWRAGLIDIVLNALPGAIFGLILGWGALGCVALAGITYISSSGIVAQVVRDLRWRRKREVPGVIGLLIVEDIVMAPYLPILTALATGAGVLAGMISVGVALAVVTIVVLLSLKQMHFLNRLLDPEEPVPLLLTVFGAAVAVAGVAMLFDFSSAVAAFLVGLLLTGDVATAARSRLAPLRDLFAAVFFVFFGLNTDPAVIPSVLPTAIALAVVGIATKMLTGYMVARRANASSRGVTRAGALLVARGEFSVVIAGIAASSAVVPDSLVPLATTYVLITAITGPVLARLAEPWADRRERRKAVPA